MTRLRNTIINELVEQYQNLTTQKAECENLMKEKTIISTSQISGYKIQLELINRDIKFIEKAFLGNKLNLDEEIRELNMTRKREYQCRDFLKEIGNVCEKHGLSLAHEDIEGRFLIHSYNNDDARWLLNAQWDYSSRVYE